MIKKNYGPMINALHTQIHSRPILQKKKTMRIRELVNSIAHTKHSDDDDNNDARASELFLISNTTEENKKEVLSVKRNTKQKKKTKMCVRPSRTKLGR